MDSPPQPSAALPLSFDGGVLRRLRRGDLATFQAYRGLPELGRYQGWSPLGDTEAAAFLAEMEDAPFVPGEWCQIGIAEPRHHSLVGAVGVQVFADERTAEVGFTLAPAAQGRGVASAAVRSVVRLLFASTEVSRVLGITDARNTHSIRLLERLEFVREETRTVSLRGELCTEHVFALAKPGGEVEHRHR